MRPSVVWKVSALRMDPDDRYKNDPEIQAMTSLVDAYQHRDVHEAEKILKSE